MDLESVRLPGSWTLVTDSDDEDAKFFFNPDTGVSQWEPPEGAEGPDGEPLDDAQIAALTGSAEAPPSPTQISPGDEAVSSGGSSDAGDEEGTLPGDDTDEPEPAGPATEPVDDRAAVGKPVTPPPTDLGDSEPTGESVGAAAEQGAATPGATAGPSAPKGPAAHPAHIPGRMYEDPAGNLSPCVVPASDVLSALELEQAGWKAAGAVAIAKRRMADSGSTSTPSDRAAARERFRAIVKTDGTVFYQSLEDKRTVWKLPPGSVVVQRARQKAAATTFTAVRAAAKLKSAWKRSSQAASAAAASAAATAAGADKPEPVLALSGWVMKTRDLAKGGRPGWKRRFAVLDREASQLRYFARNPKASLDRYGVEEPEKGAITLAGAKVAILTDGIPSGGMDDKALELRTTDGRRSLLTVPKKHKGGWPGGPGIRAWQRGLTQVAGKGPASAGPVSSLEDSEHAAWRRGHEAVAEAARASLEVETLASPLPGHTVRVCTDGHLWEASRVAVLPACRLLAVQPATEGETSPCFSVCLTGARVELTRPPGRGLQLRVTEASHTGAGGEGGSEPGAASGDSFLVSMPADGREAAFLQSSIQSVAGLGPISTPALRSICGLEIFGPPAVARAEAFKCGPTGTSWKARTLHVSPAGGFFRYMSPTAAASGADPELAALGAASIQEGPIRSIPGTGVLRSAAPAVLGLRAVPGSGRSYVFCFERPAVFAVMFGSLALLHRKSDAGLA